MTWSKRLILDGRIGEAGAVKEAEMQSALSSMAARRRHASVMRRLRVRWRRRRRPRRS